VSFIGTLGTTCRRRPEARVARTPAARRSNAPRSPTETKRAPERGALYAYVYIRKETPAGVLGRGGLGGRGAPGIDQFWPIMFRRLYKIAHLLIIAALIFVPLTAWAKVSDAGASFPYIAVFISVGACIPIRVCSGEWP
jgi:hypothetical protein